MTGWRRELFADDTGLHYNTVQVYMRELHRVTHQPVNLSVRQGDEIVYIDRSYSERSGMQVVRAIGGKANAKRSDEQTEIARFWEYSLPPIYNALKASNPAISDAQLMRVSISSPGGSSTARYSPKTAIPRFRRAGGGYVWRSES